MSNTAAELYQEAETLQTEARDLRDALGRLYARAGRLKQLAVTAATELNPQPQHPKDNTANG